MAAKKTQNNDNKEQSQQPDKGKNKTASSKNNTKTSTEKASKEAGKLPEKTTSTDKPKQSKVENPEKKNKTEKSTKNKKETSAKGTANNTKTKAEEMPVKKTKEKSAEKSKEAKTNKKGETKTSPKPTENPKDEQNKKSGNKGKEKPDAIIEEKKKPQQKKQTKKPNQAKKDTKEKAEKSLEEPLKEKTDNTQKKNIEQKGKKKKSPPKAGEPQAKKELESLKQEQKETLKQALMLAEETLQIKIGNESKAEKIDDKKDNAKENIEDNAEKYTKYVVDVKEKEGNFKSGEDENNHLEYSSKLEKILPVDTDKPSELLRKVLTIMSAIIIIVCLVVLVVSTMGGQRGKGSPDRAKTPEAGFVGTSNEDKNVFPEGIQEKNQNLYLVNKDTVGVISIDSTTIEQPVVQYKDNEYYLTHDFYKKKSDQGTIFMDVTCKPDLSIQNTVLYASNNKEGTFIFSPLLEYQTKEGYKKAPVITFNTLTADYQWKIYACFFTTVKAEDDNGYVFDFASQKLNETNFAGFLQQVDMRKLYTTGVDILPTEKLLTIAIPSFNIYGTDKKPVETKFVILARQLRDGESEEIVASQIRQNTNIYKPQAYYDSIRRENKSTEVPRWSPD
ncbi:MAG: hypothetical protein RSD17_00340 [Oscillospiraceae bacterium]